MDADQQKLAELSAIVTEVRDRVRARTHVPDDSLSGNEAPPIRIPLADLMPIVHARDAAQAKVASIGAVNPRAGGLANKAIQGVKKTIARAFQWFVRGQISYNREALSAVEAILEALNEHNRVLASLARQTNEQLVATRADMAGRVRELSQQIDVRAEELKRYLDGQLSEHLSASYAKLDAIEAETLALKAGASELKAEARELKDVRTHWMEWRRGWEEKLATNEIQFLRAAADLQSAFQYRLGQLEASFRDTTKAQHSDYLGALDRTTHGIQKQLFEDFGRIRADYDRMIHTELRLIRQRLNAAMATVPAGAPTAAPIASAEIAGMDYSRFAERFRGSEEYVRGNQELYRGYFTGCTNVLDIGCGRGEFLELMKELGVPARGIELSAESVAQCHGKGLEAQVADLFEYLPAQPEEEFDGIFCSQVIEHLPPSVLPRLVNLCASRLRKGGVIAFETPNPECLAIFATHFYLDPTHVRPVPHDLMSFYMDEAGLGGGQLHRLSPAIETMPELAGLPEEFRTRFFGSLDYAIVARKL